MQFAYFSTSLWNSLSLFLTIIRECFHLVSLFNTLNKLMHENMFLQQYGDVSPISKVSAVNSGCSPMTQEGKSNKAMLKIKNWKNENKFHQNKTIFRSYLFLLAMYAMIFWLKNFKTNGIQLANTRCWDINSNW